MKAVVMKEVEKRELIEIPPGFGGNRQGVDPKRARGHASAARRRSEFIFGRCVHRRAAATVGVTAW
jgi:hypothetical protein